MPEQLLTVLKICLLALLYLFFFRVLRAVWAEVSPPKRPATAAKAAKPARKSRGGKVKGARRLTVTAPAALKGMAFVVTGEVTIGRANGCTVTVDDTYASQIHARVFQQDGQFFVEDLGSTNGTYLNRKKVTGRMVFRPGDKLQIGNTVMELK